VYRAYTIWCARRGHKMPEAQHRFTPAFMSMNGVRRGEPRVRDPEKLGERLVAADELRKRRVFYMGTRPQGMEDREWLDQSIKNFVWRSARMRPKASVRTVDRRQPKRRRF
jgi:hypothetical protein